jgi:hypothetical protein
MSLPASMTSQALSSITAISPLDNFLQIFNTNPYFIGIMMLILNLGGRFIGLEVTKKQELFFQHPLVRRCLIFTVLFIATRNLWVAFWTTIAVVLFLGYLFNENSSLCLFGSGGVKGSKCDTEKNTQQQGLTPEEKEILQRLTSKAQRYDNIDSKKNFDDNTVDVPHTDIYTANHILLKK